MIRFPPQRIMVPFDFTEPSQAAWGLAKSWARRFSAKLDIVYVEDLLPSPAWEWRPTLLSAKAKKDIGAHLRSKVGTEPKIHVSDGDVTARLLGYARGLKPDLIVMGTHGRTGFEHFWLGSVAEAITRLSPVPVLTVRAPVKSIGSVLAPVNFTPYAEYGFIFAAGVASALGKSLTALHVTADAGRCPNPEFRMRSMIARLNADARKICRPEVLLAHGSPTEAIVKAARAYGLVVLVAHRKPLLEDWVLGMTAERVLRHSGTPVLAVPAPKSEFNWEKWVELRELQAAPA